MSFRALFERYVLATADHQLHAQEVLGDKPFAADLGAGRVEIGDVTARAELVGTESTGAGSWLWAWANRSGFGDHVLRAARHAREVGERAGIPELTSAELPLDGTEVGHRCAVVTCGLAGGYVYYPVEAAPGTTAFLLLDAPELALPPVRLERVVTVLTTVASGGQVTDWRAALAAYGSLRGLGTGGDERGVTLDGGARGSVRVELDAQGRVANIEGHLRPGSP